MATLASRTPSTRLAAGWVLTGLITLALLAASAAVHGLAGGGTEGYRAVIRLTARTSLVLFLMSFIASSLVRLAPSPATRWMIRNRRYLGVSFAMSHLIHAVAIVALARSDADLFWQLTTVGSIVTGTSTYLIIALMTATSFDATARWIGPRVWRSLHWWGALYIWVSFVFTNGKRVPMSLWYLVPVALLGLALAARLIAARRSARQRTSPATGIP
jgi:sulfoxide reductase heme-binding subunit YedZ